MAERENYGRRKKVVEPDDDPNWDFADQAEEPLGVITTTGTGIEINDVNDYLANQPYEDGLKAIEEFSQSGSFKAGLPPWVKEEGIQGWDHPVALTYRTQVVAALGHFSKLRDALGSMNSAPKRDQEAIKVLSKGLDDYFRILATILSRESYSK